VAPISRKLGGTETGAVACWSRSKQKATIPTKKKPQPSCGGKVRAKGKRYVPAYTAPMTFERQPMTFWARSLQ
jgi:hypothetical protein